MLRLLTRPFAIVSHLLVLTVIVACVLLGQWQFARLTEVRAVNSRLAERLALEPLELTDIGSQGAPIDDDALEFRRVAVEGTFRPDQEVLQRNREHQGQAGFHLLTPLEFDSGQVVLVRRGWVPSAHDEPPVTEAPPPTGTVRVTGYLERSVSQPGFGARDPDDGQLERVFHADVTRLDRQVDGALFPMVVAATETDPPTPQQFPLPIGDPELDEGNHLSYALQWYSFSVLALISYVAWWRTRIRRGTDDRPRTGPNAVPPSDDVADGTTPKAVSPR